MAVPMISADVDDLLNMYDMSVTSPVFKNAALIDSYQDVDGSLLSWPSPSSPIAQDSVYVNRFHGKKASSLSSKKRQRQETERNRQRRYRQRLRNEREMLENEVNILSRQLERVKEDFVQRQNWCTTTVSPIESSSLSVTVDESEKRRLAKCEHQQLQATVKMQAAYIEHLRMLVPGGSFDDEA
ncbi:hypothetical protein GN244_ATG12852 [Phytophthora infestans]|uniref:BZIP domain-containing protein n=1 Tax=Phytophthora infestans TaxID=4787 RepID=A0A833SPQ4_PHYIN|nr:hypothetical protein GN244_ATG12852 [Phytophthora infestans]KAF4134749.1 hypothetical protein GN958_ATG16005 [Phytophthora infestans]KAF4147969.1 hypothetical protein GN958_ATG02848 [Phytophthora infestans]